MYKRLRNIFIIAGFFLAGSVVHAQALAPAPVQYVVTPQTPGPNQTVQIQVEAVGSFLGDSTITWSENGQTAQSGTNANTFSFTTGALGSQTNIQVVINSPSQGVITHDFTFSPSLVDLVWEADTTVPPLYRGKPLYSAGSNLKVVAFPTIVSGKSTLPISVLSFQWQLAGNSVPEQSGLGQNTLTFAGDQLQNSEEASVEVDYNGSEAGYGEINIPATTPQLLLYEKDPLRGLLLDEALPSAVSLTATEITLEAEPYYFSNESEKNGSLAYAWTLDGNSITGPQSAQGILTLRQTGSGTGEAALGVSLQNNDSDKLVQAAQTAVEMVFGQQSSGLSSFFGL